MTIYPKSNHYRPSTIIVSFRLHALFLSVLLLGCVPLVTGQTPAAGFVQGNYDDPRQSQNTMSATFTQAQQAGDLNLVVVCWSDGDAQVQSLTDTAGNTYALAAGPTVVSGHITQAVYYSKNIISTAANANTVTVQLSAVVDLPDMRIAEYSGLDPSTPIDTSLSVTGTGITMDSGPLTTIQASDLLVVAGGTRDYIGSADPTYINRMTTSDGDILEDMLVPAVGTYRAIAAQDGSHPWVMQLVAFRLASNVFAGAVQTNYEEFENSTRNGWAGFNGPQTAGNINVAIVSWRNSAARVGEVIDTMGNTYVLAAGPVQTGTLNQAIYYAKNIVSALPRQNVIGINLTDYATDIEVQIAEYSGLDTVNPLDVTVGAQGSGSTSDSGLVETTNWDDLLVGANTVDTATTSAAGAGFLERFVTSPFGDILEDAEVSSVGSYQAAAPLSGTADWIMQMVAFGTAASSGGSSAPFISSLSPSTGPIGSAVTIAGGNFGSVQGSSTVSFNGVVATSVSSWSSTSITAYVPQGATSGNVVIKVGNQWSNGVRFGLAVPSPTYIQGNSADSAGPQSQLSATYPAAQLQGDLNVVAIGWQGDNVTVNSVTDASGNTYTLALTTPLSGFGTQAIYYAPNLSSSGTNQNQVTVTFNQPATNLDVRIAEYEGLDPQHPVDAVAGGTGSSGDATSASVTTTNAYDLLFGAIYSEGSSFGASPYRVRVTSSPYGNLIEDASVSVAGSYYAESGLSPASPWIMQMVAFRMAPPATQQNQPPAVNAGPNQTITLPTNTVTLNGTASDDGLPNNTLTISWSKVSGPGTVSFSSPSAAVSNASFSASGVYVLQLSANDSQLTSVSTTTVTVNPEANSIVATAGTMSSSRSSETATQLTNGNVLLAGGIDSTGVLSSAEVYSLATQTFSSANSMNLPRWLHTATLLNDGTVLIAGGSSLANETTLNSAEIYDPVAGTFTLLPSTLNTARVAHTATLLANGQVLIVGGYDPTTGIIADSELYDPTSQVFIDLGNTNTPRFRHTATLLQNGQVLIAGGGTDATPSGANNNAELFDSTSLTFSLLPSTMTSSREGHTATLLNDGTVLIAGGDLPGSGSRNTAEIYSPSTGAFTASPATMTYPRIFHGAVLLNGGKVLLSGGEEDSGGTSTALSSAELYDPILHTFTLAAGQMSTGREHQSSTLLSDGTVLEAGGTDGTNVFNTADIYLASKLTGLASIAVSPASTSVPVGSGQLFTAIGTLNDGSTLSLASVIWSSADNTIATVTNDSTDSGMVFGVAADPVAISACTSSICGSTASAVAPSVANLNPTTGGPGSPVSISGAGFGSSQGSSTIAFNGVSATVTTWNATSIVAVVPAGATTGSVVVTVNGVPSTGVPFVVPPPPTITSITPTALSAGAQVAITGTGFGASQGSGYVLLSNAYGLVTTWSDTQIVAVVQPGTASGNLYVHQNGYDSNAVAFTSSSVASAPAIMNLTPASGILGDQIIINGVNFGAAQGSSSITFNGATAFAATWSDNSIAASVPSNATSGNVVVTVNGVASNATPFTILTPTITTLSPSSGAIGATVTITGTGFGAAQGPSGVSFNNVAASVTAWGDTSITVVVPNGASTGNVEVFRSSAYSSVASNGVPFTVPQNAPSIASLSPNSGLPGTLITISGANFGSSQGNSMLTFNGIVAVPTAWTANSMSVAVPTAATSGGVVVVVNGVASNALSFNVPSLASISVAPANASIAPGTTQPFTATGIYSDGSKQPLSSATWSSTASSVATISTTGAASAITQGQSTIQATFGGVVGSATLTVGSAVGSFSTTGSLTTPRSGHTATLLTSGQVLIAGGADSNSKNTNSAELYNPTTGAFAATGNLNTARQWHTAVLLNNGMVLIAGGQDIHGVPLTSAELYDPGTGNFASTGNLNTAREYASATLLTNGKVLIVGGAGGLGVLSSSEIYDPGTGAFTMTGSLTTARVYHTATLLNDGTVLIAGGQTSGITALGTAEIYNPTAGTFTALSANLNDARNSHTATLLNNGKVLLAQGFDNNSNVLGSAELYDPVSQTFTYTASPNSPRNGSSATLLSNGAVLLAGGYDANLTELLSAETYDPVAAAFTTIGNLTTARKFDTATLLNNGNVLIVGGLDINSNTLGSAEVYQPATTAPATLVSVALSPSNASVPVATALRFSAVGTFSDSTTQTLPSVGWSSSATSVATVTSDSTNAGAVFAVSVGTATINACAGSICGSAAITVPSGQMTGLTITPANPVLAVGASVPLLATATFSDGGVQDFTAFVTWSSSSPNTASVNPTTGMATGIATGATTITATYGSTTANTTLAVPPPLASIAISPTSPTVSVGGTQQFVATATYTDGSTSNITNSVQWAVAAAQVANISATGTLTATSQGTDAVSASLGGVSTSASVTVVALSPMITGVSPTSGAAGTQVSVSGSGFGSAQGAGAVWLGTSPGAVVSWSDSQIIATIAPGSNSGTVQVWQNGVASNSQTFTVNTATVEGVSPAAGPPGSQVTISGSGFGTAQGSGQVWLGTAVGQVVSWSDTQVVALVVAGSTTGAAQILQNGVWSNSVPFTVTGGAPHITGITPTSGSAGTIVTIQGSGFGPYEGNGAVWIGGAYGEVQGWSDSTVVVSVAGNAVSGTVKVLQNGAWSNALTFTVPGNFGSGGTSVTLVPNTINMVVGDTRTLQALGTDNQPVTGLTWSSSNTSVISLSTDDPPILTAVAPGNATITAGNASADVTVFTGPTLPLGTVIWSNPGDGSGVNYIVPAVPSSTGVADVFAVNESGNLQAILSDGTVGWTRNIGTNNLTLAIPDFQGGEAIYTGNSIYKLDGMTGQPYPAYTGTSSQDQHNGGIGYPAIHTDGTIFTTDSSCASVDCPGSTDSVTGSWVVGVDPSTGTSKIRAAAQNSTARSTVTAADNLCGITGSGSGSVPAILSNSIIAGDGYLYTSYLRINSQSNIDEAAQPFPAAAYPLYQKLGGDLQDQFFSGGGSAAVLADISALRADVAGRWSGAYQLTNLQQDEQNVAGLSGVVPQGEPASLDPNFPASVDELIYQLDLTPRSDASGVLSLISKIQPYASGQWLSYLQQLMQFEQWIQQNFSQVWNDYSSIGSAFTPLCNHSSSATYEVHLLKVGTDGSSPVDTVERSWQVTTSLTYGTNADNPWSYTQTQSGQEPSLENTYLITNADQGALMSWEVAFPGYCAIGTDQGCTSYVNESSELHLTNSTSGDVVWPAAVPNQSGPVQPTLQLQDGSYVGTALSSIGTYMVKFNASGQVLNMASGGVYNAYFPQIATADGGVIASPNSVCSPSGCPPGPAATFDANLNLTGQMSSLPTQSWLGNEYTDGPVNQVAEFPIDIASDFWPFASANASGNGNGVSGGWFPPLDHCSTTPVCPYDAIYNALRDLIQRLANPVVADAAQKNILARLGTDALGNLLTTAGFLRYLGARRGSLEPGFYNGLTSTYCDDSLTSGHHCFHSDGFIGGLFHGLLNGFAVMNVFNANPDINARTATPGFPLLTFFRPTSILSFSSGKNIGNEAMIFHEALHGLTGQIDANIQIELLNKPNAPDHSLDPSCEIDIKVDRTVLSLSPDLDQHHLPCPCEASNSCP